MFLGFSVYAPAFADSEGATVLRWPMGTPPASRSAYMYFEKNRALRIELSEVSSGQSVNPKRYPRQKPT